LILPVFSGYTTVNFENRIPSVYISKEIVQKRDVGKHTIKSIEKYLIHALQQPTDKISRHNSIIPSGRFFTDYIMNFKFLNPLEVIGYTINPEHVKGVAWNKIVGAVPHSRVVILLRSNAVKMAFSGKLFLSEYMIYLLTNILQSISGERDQTHLPIFEPEACQ